MKTVYLLVSTTKEENKLYAAFSFDLREAVDKYNLEDADAKKRKENDDEQSTVALYDIPLEDLPYVTISNDDLILSVTVNRVRSIEPFMTAEYWED